MTVIRWKGAIPAVNPYLKNLNKIEFVVTDACTGQCKHCAAGAHGACGIHIDPQIAADAVRKTAAVYDLKTVMAFGGEPLLYPDTVYAVMDAARDCRIPKRQVITNGYFTRDGARIREVAKGLAACGVNDLLLSVDAFHQETVPLDAVYTFAAALKAEGVPVRLSPAWLVSREDGNPYNRQTRAVLAAFSDLTIPVGEGNIVFPAGNAKKYLSAYFADGAPDDPYEEDPLDIRTLSVCANGDLLGGNLYRQDVLEIIKNYKP